MTIQQESLNGDIMRLVMQVLFNNETPSEVGFIDQTTTVSGNPEPKSCFHKRLLAGYYTGYCNGFCKGLVSGLLYGLP